MRNSLIINRRVREMSTIKGTVLPGTDASPPQPHHHRPGTDLAALMAALKLLPV
jgi:hypothetical protein